VVRRATLLTVRALEPNEPQTHVASGRGAVCRQLEAVRKRGRRFGVCHPASHSVDRAGRRRAPLQLRVRHERCVERVVQSRRAGPGGRHVVGQRSVRVAGLDAHRVVARLQHDAAVGRKRVAAGVAAEADRLANGSVERRFKRKFHRRQRLKRWIVLRRPRPVAAWQKKQDEDEP